MRTEFDSPRCIKANLILILIVCQRYYDVSTASHPDQAGAMRERDAIDRLLDFKGPRQVICREYTITRGCANIFGIIYDNRDQDHRDQDHRKHIP